MAEFPRTMVGGVSLSRMIIGTNWFFGYSHTSLAKDKFITSYQTRQQPGGHPDRFLQGGHRHYHGVPEITLPTQDTYRTPRIAQDARAI